ncbi:MAG: phosphoglycolate phosphatase [Proteobacteria bacterium]|nr:phosphoglycolate phosphatase [Pseudomonadota bacterium]
MPVEALIFDLDGTLVDTAPDLLLATNHVLAEIGRPALSMAQLRAFVGHGAMNLIERGINATGEPQDQATLKRLHKHFLEYYGDNIAVSSVFFDGLDRMLAQAEARGLKFGVCTNKVEHLSVKLLQELGQGRRFPVIVGGDTLPVMKPDPAPYLEVARRLGVDPARTMMFGDSETDILTAKNAGVPVVAVTFGYTAKHVSNFAPTHMIDHYDEAWPIVETYL